jgi:uncharacterized protein
MNRPSAAPLVGVLPPRQHILITGANGFIGTRLCEALVAGGHQVTALVRGIDRAATLPPATDIVTRLDQLGADCRLDAIVNLAGEPIARGRWTEARKLALIDSRLTVTRAVIDLIRRLDSKPGVLVSGSAIGWYGMRGDEPLSEADAPRDCFSHQLCAAWEACARDAEAFSTRTVLLRIGIVLGVEGGALANLITPFRFGGGGPIGDGRQWMSWITRDDLIRLIAHVIATPQISGPLNATAPHPVRNAEFVAAFGKALHRPALLRMPAFAMRLLFGEMAAELLLHGQRVIPVRALATGFAFQNTDIADAFGAVLGNDRK